MYTLTVGNDSAPRVNNPPPMTDSTFNCCHSFVKRLASIGNACLAPFKKAAIKTCQLANNHPKFVLLLTAVISTTFAVNQIMSGHRSIYTLMIIAGPSTIGAGIVGTGHLAS